MPRPLSFTGHLVAASRAHAVVAPPYDSLSPDQRTAMAAADPESFLNALPAAGPGDADELERTLVACRASVDRLLESGRFVALDRPVLGVVGIGAPPRRTLAVVGDLPVEEFDLEATGAPGMVRPHERVNPARVEQLARYLEVVGVASSPVAVTHRPDHGVDRLTAAIAEGTPQLAFRGEDGVDIAVWVVEGNEADRLADAVADAGTLYIADGHHRAAAVAAVAARDDRRVARVLTAAIPSDQLEVLPFHRRLVGAPDPSAVGVEARLRAAGLSIVELDGAQLPMESGTVTVTAEGRWWAVELPANDDGDDPTERLDVRRMERSVLPALTEDGVRVEPSAGPAGLGAIEGPATIGVALAPPGVGAILEVSDARGIMPPKTTYVTPKLRSGLFLAHR